ncbi:MAG: RluA family pseudouridine synthase [Pseudomonadota bacterium]
MSADENAVIRLVVGPDNNGLRLDRFAAGSTSELSRQRIKHLILEGAVTVDDDVCRDASRKLRADQIVSVHVPPSEPAVYETEAIDLNIAHEDEHLIVVDKPAGMVTHPAPGHASGTLVNALLAHSAGQLSGIGGVQRPGIVHRLDKDTSGLLVVAKSDRAHKGLSEQFASHGADGKLQRTYAALVWGTPERRVGRVSAPIGRSRTNRRKMAIIGEPEGRHAATHYKVERAFDCGENGAVSLLQLNLETGRTHQIRVHMTSIGHPLLGDQAYGAGFKSSARKLLSAAQQALTDLDRQALHAATLGFEHPVTGENLQFESPVPDDMVRLINALETGN